ncbi:hypothetical protein V6N13_086959 [Hibiscus sabdariffa]|uniref:Origin recognition complex subunit 5 C-terminal domain-containing protein n=1 Tax=Hibiscus sabdariffa TaxID=183260 RepID=A0ABR2FUW2_9ROSI
MSTSAKYLLISAFLASRNPATLDASLFDSTGVSDSRKRKRKASEKSMDQKEMAEQELLMKGLGTFPLERLLAIFQCITYLAEDSLDEEDSHEPTNEGGSRGLMSDVLLQLSSLCNANFIIKGGSCPMEGSTRYRTAVSEDLALKVIFSRLVLSQGVLSSLYQNTYTEDDLDVKRCFININFSVNCLRSSIPKSKGDKFWFNMFSSEPYVNVS